MINALSKLAGMIGGLVLLAIAAPAIAKADEKVIFNIPEQSLSQSLLDYSDTTGVKILFNENLARGIKIQGLSGQFTNEQGLKELLDSSGLNYRFTSPKAVIIEQPEVSSLSSEMLLAQSPKSDYPADVITDDSYSGPVEQEDLTVSGRELNGYSVLNANTATKTNTPIFDTPVAIQVVPKAVMDDQQAVTLIDAIRNVSGVIQGA